MNNSFIFTPPAAKSATPSHGQDFKASRKSGAPAQPFSNVLDRAVHTQPKPKHDSLAGGRSAAHRTEHAGEDKIEREPSDPLRSSKRKNKQNEQEAIHPAIWAGMPAPMIPMTPMAVVTAPVMAEGETEAVITVTDCSDSAFPTTEVVGAVLADGAESLVGSTAAKASADMIKMMDVSDAPAASSETSAMELKPALPAESLPPMQQVKSALDISQINPDPTSETVSFVSDVADARAETISTMVVSTAREVAASISSGESVSNHDSEIIETATEPLIANATLPDEARRTVRAARRAWVESLENERGTGGAKITVSMNNLAKQENIAGLTQQILPGAQSPQVVSTTNLPSESLRSVGGEISSLDALGAAARFAGGPTRSDDSVSGELLEMRGTSPAARMGEVISREVRMFKRGGDDLVEVVLTPDTKTQISLKLQWRDGQVEVQARCDMGDHRSLNTEWPQLQASLAAHGVRLSHLSERVQTGFTEFFSNSGFSQQRGGERQAASQQGVADVVTPTVVQPTKSGAAKSVIRANNRLESWA